MPSGLELAAELSYLADRVICNLEFRLSCSWGKTKLHTHGPWLNSFRVYRLYKHDDRADERAKASPRYSSPARAAESSVPKSA